MSSAEVKENQEPRIYLDAFNFEVRVQVSPGVTPKKRPGSDVAQRLHLQTYQFDSRANELRHAPRRGVSGSTNGAKLNRADWDVEYGGQNRKESRRGLRNQLTLVEKQRLDEEIDGQYQPCDRQLDLASGLVTDIATDMGPGVVTSVKVYKSEFYFEVLYGCSPEIVRERLEKAIRNIAGTEAEVKIAPRDSFVGRYWEIPVEVNGRYRKVQIKSYIKGDFVRVECVFNGLGQVGDPGDRARLIAVLRDVRSQAVTLLTALYSEVSDLGSCRSEEDLSVLIKYVTTRFRSRDDVVGVMKRQYVEYGRFFVSQPVKADQTMKYILGELAKAGVLNRQKPHKIGAGGKSESRKRGQTFRLAEKWEERIGQLVKARKLAKRRSKRKTRKGVSSSVKETIRRTERRRQQLRLEFERYVHSPHATLTGLLQQIISTADKPWCTLSLKGGYRRGSRPKDSAPNTGKAARRKGRYGVASCWEDPLLSAQRFDRSRY